MYCTTLVERLIAATLTNIQPSRGAVSDRCGNPGLWRNAVSAASFRRTSRSAQRRGGWGGGREAVRRAGLKLLVVSALATLSVLLMVSLTHNSAAATSTPLLASTTTNVFDPTPHAAAQDEEANLLASFGGRDYAARGDAMAAALGFMGVAPPPRLDDRSGPDISTVDVARVIAEAFATGADSAGSGVHGGSVSSGGLAILIALGMLPDRQLSCRICTDYLCHLAWVFSRPPVHPG
jgi:hypothetical protein